MDVGRRGYGKHESKHASRRRRFPALSDFPHRLAGDTTDRTMTFTVLKNLSFSISTKSFVKIAGDAKLDGLTGFFQGLRSVPNWQENCLSHSPCLARAAREAGWSSFPLASTPPDSRSRQNRSQFPPSSLEGSTRKEKIRNECQKIHIIHLLTISFASSNDDCLY
jgi:hypothetical protein